MATTPVTTGVNVGGDVISGGNQFDFSSMIPTILEKFIAVIEGVIIIAAGFFAIRYLHGKLRKIESTHENQRNAVNLLEKITTGFIVVISITLALKIIGLDMTLLVSVAILGLSYGLQDIIKNYVAGILILFKAPFKIGDVVKIRDFTGRVTNMDFQSTTLETFDNRHITIYNSDVMTQSIINFSNNSMRRLDFDVGVGYGSSIPHALKIFNNVLKNNARVLQTPPYSIIFKKFADNGPVFTLRFWIQRPCNIPKIKTEIAALIGQAFDEENILAPYIKGIELEDETFLSKVSDERKKRIQAFYTQPMFAEAAEQAPAPEQPGTEAVPPPEPFDFEEPEN
jgi:small-conductance mechanosensitive channel